jgi:hypothetical protein
MSKVRPALLGSPRPPHHRNLAAGLVLWYRGAAFARSSTAHPTRSPLGSAAHSPSSWARRLPRRTQLPRTRATFNLREDEVQEQKRGEEN